MTKSVPTSPPDLAYGAAARRLRRLIAGLSRNWPWFYLLAVSLYLAGALAAPVLARAGRDREAAWIYAAYRISCHQLPHHSWFLGGPAAAYPWSVVQPYGPWEATDAKRAFHHPLHTPALGYQVAICQRDTAIWGALLLGSGILIATGRRAGCRRPRAIGLLTYGLAALPMAVDAGSQLLGWRESTPLLRSLTGGLFGLATAALVVPLLAEGFTELAEDLADDRIAGGGPPAGGGAAETPGH